MGNIGPIRRKIDLEPIEPPAPGRPAPRPATPSTPEPVKQVTVS